MTTTDYRPALGQAYDQAARVLEGIKPDQLGGATACPDYDVAGLIDHIVGAGEGVVAMGKGEERSMDFAHVELAEAPGKLSQAGQDAAAAWGDDSRLTAEITMPWGETYTGQTVVEMYATELATHAWDLAAATGQLDRLDPALATSVLAAARSMLNPAFRDAMGKGKPFGAEVSAPADATDWERLAAFMGRDPRP